MPVRTQKKIMSPCKMSIHCEQNAAHCGLHLDSIWTPSGLHNHVENDANAKMVFFVTAAHLMTISDAVASMSSWKNQ